MRLFAGLRERAGWSERTVEADHVCDIWASLALGEEPSGLLYAVNREWAAREQALADGDVVALIPPVSGGAFLVSSVDLSLARAVEEVASAEAGAIATFIGTARRHSRGREVAYLEYEAYEEMAEDMMARLGGELVARYELLAVAIHHRIGRVELGEPSVVIAVSAPHRTEALAACAEAIERLKSDVPLWKKEVYDGGAEWIGQGS